MALHHRGDTYMAGYVNGDLAADEGSQATAVAAAAPVVRLTDLNEELGGTRILNGISFEVRPAEIFGLLGVNGAGKTTTLRVISTLLYPDAGTAQVAGFDVESRPREVRRQLGVVTAALGVYPRLTAFENIAYFGALHGLKREPLRRRVLEMVELLEMGEFVHRRAGLLSSGELQKTAIARALVHDPPVLIFDEPTSNLDVLASRTVRNVMSWAREQGKAVIFSTHILHDAERLCDRVVIIHGGRVVAEGTPLVLKERTGTTDLEDALVALISEE